MIAAVALPLLIQVASADPMVRADSATPRQVIEAVSVLWRAGAEPYLVTVEELEDLPGPDGDSPRLRIRVPGGKAHEFVLPGGVGRLAEGLLDSALAADNLLRSPHLYMSPKLRDARGTPLLVVVGRAFASDPGIIRMLDLDAEGTPRERFASDAFGLTALDDLDGDGMPEIIGVRALAEALTECAGSYNPYAVYRLAHDAAGVATYDVALSEAYNRSHYYGWAGPDRRDDMVINRCAPSGPRLMDWPSARVLEGRP